MKMNGWIIGRGLFLLLIGVSLWFRTTSLETMPDIDGDEAWHAVQLTNMLRGEPYTLVTETGLPLSPIHASLELPLLMTFGPSPAILRIPSVLTGILAMMLAYVLGSRVLDKTTAMIATGLFAALPVATYCARTGYESSHAPLFTLLLLYCAFRLNVVWMSILLLCSYFVHPTNIFILPALVAIMAARLIPNTPGESYPWRRFVLKAIPPTTIVVAIGLWTIQRPIINKMSTVYASGIGGKHDLIVFLKYFGHLFLALGKGSWPRADLLIWSIFSIVLTLGLARLVQARRWDRVALVLGLVASVAALFLVGGSNIIQPGMVRYGYFLVVPTVFAFACLLDAMLVAPSGGWSGPARSVQIAVLLALGGTLLMHNRLDLGNQSRVISTFDRRGEESPWTFGSDREDPRKQGFDYVLDDMARRGADRARIFNVEPIAKFYLRLLSLSHPGVEILGYDQMETEEGREAILAGSYTINSHYDPVYADRTFLSHWAEQWETPCRDGISQVTVSRMAMEFPVSGDFDHDGRVDPAYFRRSDAHWIASLSGGGTMDVAFGSHDMLEIPVPGDYDGDRKLDLAVFHPATDLWDIKYASGVVETQKFGNEHAFEVPVPRDFDGDGKVDIGVFLPADSAFAIKSSKTGQVRFQKFGIAERSEPVPADYDGDGVLDLAVFIHDKAVFGYLPSKGGPEVYQPIGPRGRSAPAPGDYDGDGRTDFAVYIPGSSMIAYRPSKGGEDVIQPFGRASDSLAAPGDYDGDGKTDLAVYIAGSNVLAYRPSKGGGDVLAYWGGGKASIAASNPPTRR